VAIGTCALSNTTSIGNQTAVGACALRANTTGHSNTALGYFAACGNTTGCYNTAIGRAALKVKTTGSSNTAVGYNALTTTSQGQYNTSIGAYSLDAVTTSNYNTANGFNAGTDITSGCCNVTVGAGAGKNVTTGIRNTIIGMCAGNDLTTGSNNVLIGKCACADAVGTDNVIAMGENVVSINNAFSFGNGGTDSRIAFGATSITAPSDMRLKEDIQDDTAGLSFINDLRPVTYRWRKEKDIPEELRTHVAGSEKRYNNDKVNHGFIAQEVKEAINKHPELKDGFDMWTEETTLDGRQRIAEGALIPMLVKAIQELTARIEDLEDK